MSLILIDTDWIIDALNGQQSALAKLEELAPGGLAVSVIAYGELYQGAYYARDPTTALPCWAISSPERTCCRSPSR